MQRYFSFQFSVICRYSIIGLIIFSLCTQAEVFALAGNEVPKKSNPINKFFQKLFQPGQKQEKKPSVSEEDTNASPDLIDKRAPQNPRHSELFKKAEEAFKRNKLDQAIKLIQYILDNKNDSVIFIENTKDIKSSSDYSRKNHWLTLKLQASELLGQFPEAKLRQYQLQYGASSERMFNDAIAQNNLKLLSDVSIRYFHTEAGRKALNLLGNKHFDRGEFCLAYRCFSRLENSTLPVITESDWQFKYAFTAYLAGQKKKSRELIKQIEKSNLAGKNTEDGQKRTDPENKISIEKKLEKLVASFEVKEPRFQEWWMMYGSPSRTGRVEKGEPLLLPRWFHPVTESSPLMKKIRYSIEDYFDSLVPVIPTIQAVAVGDKIAFRSLRGVLVLDSKTGNRIWETKTADSPEVLLEKLLNKSNRSTRRNRFRNWDYLKETENPLVDILLDNGTYGSISSDGKQLFIIENHVIMPDFFPETRRNLRGGVPTQAAQKMLTNRVISYDLSKGHPRWFVGGVPLNSRFEQKLPGCYFFGAPVCSGDDLFVVGEKNNEIRLYVLNPENGDLKWSCLLAYSTVSIKQDLVRRGWTAQVSIDQGMIVCPTTAGWIVGVNRLTQSLEWVHRFSERSKDYDPRNNWVGQDGTVPFREIGNTWLPSAPVISGNYIVYTPSEENALYCLDLATGQEAWKLDVNENSTESIYLAGVFDDKVVMVRKKGVRAYSLQDGVQKWYSPYNRSSDRLPAGIGVAVGDNYYLPMQSGVIKTISLKSGAIKGNSYLRNDKYPLGNLVMSGGMLLSLSPYGLSCFEQKEAIFEEIRKREEKNPRDVWAMLRKAEIYFLKQEDQLAIETLKILNPVDLSPKNRTRYEKVMKNSLVALIQSDFEMYHDETIMLKDLISSNADQIMYDRLISERLIQRGEHEQAFQVIWKLCERDASEYIEIGRYKKTKVLIRNWARIKLEELWKDMSEDLQENLSSSIEELAEKTLSESAHEKENYLVLFGFHPSSKNVRWNLINEYRQAKKFVEAETHLKRMLRESTPENEVKVLNALAELMLDAQLPADASYYWGLLQERYPDFQMENGKSVTGYLKGKIAGGELQIPKPVYWGWDQYRWDISRTGTSYNSSNVQKLNNDSSQLPFYQDNVFEMNTILQQLSLQSTKTGKYSWVTPLKSRSRAQNSKFIPNAFVNHQMVLVHNGVVHCMAPAENRILWTRPISENDMPENFDRFSYRSPPGEMKGGDDFKQGNYTNNLVKHNGRLGRVTNEYVCVYGRRKIQLLDPLTGNILWSKDGITAEADIFGNDKVLLVVPQDKSSSIVLNARDGSTVEVENLETVIEDNVLINEKGWLQLESRRPISLFGLVKNVTRIKLIDPVNKKIFWNHEFSFNSLFSLIDFQTLVILEPSAEMYELNLLSGKKRKIASGLNRSSIRSYSSIYTIADPENYYMFVNRRNRDSLSHSTSLTSFPVNGHIYAINRKTGKIRWEQEAQSQYLIMQQFNQSPLLLMVANRIQHQKKRKVQMPHHRQLNLVAIDKQSGKKVIDYTSIMNPNINSINFKLSKELIELRAYSDRLQIRGTKKHEVQ